MKCFSSYASNSSIKSHQVISIYINIYIYVHLLEGTHGYNLKRNETLEILTSVEILCLKIQSLKPFTNFIFIQDMKIHILFDTLSFDSKM